jgi:hypothetical protein
MPKLLKAWLTSIILVSSLLVMKQAVIQFIPKAYAQTACTVTSVSALQTYFSDSAAAGSIVPAYIRDIICSAVNFSLTPTGTGYTDSIGNFFADLFTGAPNTLPLYASTLNVSTALAGAGFTNWASSPPPIGNTAPNTGAFTTLAATTGSMTKLTLSGDDAMTYINTSGQSIPNSTNTTITGWTLVTDRLGVNFNATTGIFTAPAAGAYVIAANVLFNAAVPGAVTDVVNLLVVANGTNVCTVSHGTDGITNTVYGAEMPACLFTLLAGQTAQIEVAHNFGSAETLSTTSPFIHFSLWQVP